MRRSLQIIALAALAGFGIASAAQAGPAWDDIHAKVFAGRTIHDAGEFVQLTAPLRPTDQRAVPIAVEAAFTDGRTVRSLTLIVDENPSPVAAVFDVGPKRDAFRVATKLRLNAATEVRAIVEASDGQLYMASRFVKFAGGQGACAAPAMGSPEMIAATMGIMTLAHVKQAGAASPITPRARLTVSHPNHTGMVLDQITLLYVPLHIITDMEVRQGKSLVFAMTGSITLAQNPVVDFDYQLNGSETMQVLVRDSNGGSWAKSFPIGQGS
jgi:sulfur-oxidizing protein SoxY